MRGEFTPLKMKDKSLLCEEKDPVLLFVDPDRVMRFVGRIVDQEERTQLMENANPVKSDCGLRFSPLFEKGCLVNTSQHQMLPSCDRLRLGLQ